MSITDFIKRVTVQTAVYWEENGSDGFGGTDYKSPVEIQCRWDSHTEVMKNHNGEEFVSSAEILLNRDLKEGSLLYLGKLNDLTADEKDDPTQLENAEDIEKMDRHPLFESKTQDVFVAYL